jgi:hypothetical protein
VTATVRSIEASPRQAAAAVAVAAAARWLGDYLANGPRPPGQLHRDAQQANIGRYYVYRAADALGVQHPNRGSNSTWALPQHFVPDACEKRCDACGEIRPTEEFRRPAPATGTWRRMVATCAVCTDRRSCRSDVRAHRATGRGQSDALLDRYSPTSDNQPAVALRLALADARQAGISFELAWPAALADAREASPPKELEHWERAFWETRDAWAAAYDREPVMAAHGALAMLAKAA